VRLQIVTTPHAHPHGKINIVGLSPRSLSKNRYSPRPPPVEQRRAFPCARFKHPSGLRPVLSNSRWSSALVAQFLLYRSYRAILGARWSLRLAIASPPVPYSVRAGCFPGQQIDLGFTPAKKQPQTRRKSKSSSRCGGFFQLQPWLRRPFWSEADLMRLKSTSPRESS